MQDSEIEKGQKYAAEQNFVSFFSPGTLVAEVTRREVETWDADQAVEMSLDIVERYDSRPYGFRFSKWARTAEELDSSEIARSPMYYLGGEVRTAQEILAGTDESESILRANVEGNGHDRVWTSTTGWKVTFPLEAEDVVLDVPPEAAEA